MREAVWDETLLRTLDSEVPEAEIAIYREFLATHPPQRIEVCAGPVTYLTGGEGPHAVLVMPGGLGFLPASYGFRTIRRLERRYRVIAPDPVLIDPAVVAPDAHHAMTDDTGEGDRVIVNLRVSDATLHAFSDAIDKVRAHEGVEQLAVIGGSGAGMFAQIYFRRHYRRVPALVLFNTFVPRAENYHSYAVPLLRLMPPFMIRAYLQRTARRLLRTEVPAEVMGTFRFNTALLQAMIQTHFDKPLLVSQMRLIMNHYRYDSYSIRDLADWQGRALILSAEDDASFADIPEFVNRLPNCEPHIFPRGVGHMAPVVRAEEFYGRIERFLEQAFGAEE